MTDNAVRQRHKKDYDAPNHSSDWSQSLTASPSWFPGLVAEVYLAFLFWSQSTDMIPTIFFSPMSIVEPTEYGVEFYYAVTYASPILLVSSRVRELILSEPTWVYLGTLIGIPSFTARSFHIRSLMLMFGVGWGTLVQFSQIWIPQRRERVVSCLLIGLVILISTRFMFSTLYIVWMSRTLNNISFALGIIAANVLGSDPEIISMVTFLSVSTPVLLFPCPLVLSTTHTFFRVRRMNSRCYMLRQTIHGNQRVQLGLETFVLVLVLDV
eukprot:TRINITY_DN3736_c0_g1_i12.p1 TRINITY_DN3736_c0_g1~~TRINITY_DN3736_c0_g1_i12.p1  ORF type:complete len:285 (+),score=31.30 TRINITY_DN3736_c0_g1_i12:53-856(+)